MNKLRHYSLIFPLILTLFFITSPDKRIVFSWKLPERSLLSPHCFRGSNCKPSLLRSGTWVYFYGVSWVIFLLDNGHPLMTILLMVSMRCVMRYRSPSPSHMTSLPLPPSSYPPTLLSFRHSLPLSHFSSFSLFLRPSLSLTFSLSSLPLPLSLSPSFPLLLLTRTRLQRGISFNRSINRLDFLR